MPISEVFNMDCIEYMKSIPDKFFELAIVDPPYGIKINMNAGRKRNTKSKKRAAKKWDNNIPSKEYFDELLRISKNQIIWGGNYFTKYLKPTPSWIFWDKHTPKGVSFADGELAWTSFGSVLRKFNHPYCGFVGKDVTRFHPTQKPIALYAWLLKNYAKPGDKILDTHLGSGSSRIAAYKMGFNFFACELDEEYYADQEKRFRCECHGEITQSNGQMITQTTLF